MKSESNQITHWIQYFTDKCWSSIDLCDGKFDFDCSKFHYEYLELNFIDDNSAGGVWGSYF